MQVSAITDEVRAVATGLKSTPFGATFLCKTEDVPKGASTKIPTVKELFVAFTEEGLAAAPDGDPFGM